MRNSALIILFIFLCLQAICQSDFKKIKITDDLFLFKISEHVYIHTSYYEYEVYGRIASNGMIYTDNEEALLFDTPVTDSLTEILCDYITGSMKLRIKAFVPNHWHNDCAGGIAHIKKAGIPSYANQKTIDIMKLKGLPEPDYGFTDSLILHCGENIADCHFLGGAHSSDNIVVWIPSEKVLFAGCMIKELKAGNLGNLSDADMTSWPETINKINIKFSSVLIVIPGHGSAGGKELLYHTTELLMK